jgi:hypothetical protein
MLRVTTAAAALSALFGGAVAAHAGDPPVPSVGAPIVKVVDCSITDPTRSATFYGRMDTVPGASKLAIRFTLLERLGRAEGFTKLDLPALRQWNVSQAGVKRFGWKQTVANLHAGGAYKARVQFRWLTPTGAAIDTQTLDTPICRGPLPNIAVGTLTARAGPTPDTTTYLVDVENNGKADADGVEVSLSVDHAVLDTATIDSLAAGEVRTVSFTGPTCQQEVSVTADPSNLIGERSEDDNTRAFACP